MSKDMLGKVAPDNPDVLMNKFFQLIAGADGDMWLMAFSRFLLKENPWPKIDRPWREENGVIYFSVTSDGTTGPEWIDRLQGQGSRLTDKAKHLLRSDSFHPTTSVVIEVAILKGNLFNRADRIVGKICTEAMKRELTRPNAEISCLIREKFSDKQINEMGFKWILTMHKPIESFSSGTVLLSVDSDGDGPWLFTGDSIPDYGWGSNTGFAFVVPDK